MTKDELLQLQLDPDPMASFFEIGQDRSTRPLRINEKYFGFGFGLPVSRVYARYFGGEVRIFPMDGYGTDTYIHLNRQGNVPEQLYSEPYHRMMDPELKRPTHNSLTDPI